MDIKEIFKNAGENILNDFKKSVGVKSKDKDQYNKDATDVEEILNNIWLTNNFYIKQDGELLIPTIQESKEYPWGVRVVILVPQGLSAEKIIEKKEVFESSFDKNVKLDKKGGRIYLQVLNRRLRTKISYKKEVYEGLEDYELAIPIGYTQKGFEYIDLTETYHHILVGGITGLGKTAFLRQGLYSMCQVYNKYYLNIYGIDLKGGKEFRPFLKVPHVKKVARTKKDTKKLLKKMNTELTKRMMRKDDRIKPLPHIVIVIDELAELQGIKKAISRIERLSRLSRSENIHLILSTQRPSADVLDGNIKANLAATVAFKTRNQINSRILLDNHSADDLPFVPGRCVLQRLREKVCQVPLLKKKRLYKQYGRGVYNDNAFSEKSNGSPGKVVGN